MKFTPGDRVAVYHQAIRKTGVVTKVRSDTLIEVNTGDGSGWISFHIKQCRKLVKNTKRRIWINPNIFIFNDNNSFFLPPGISLSRPSDDAIEFVEVRIKKL